MARLSSSMRCELCSLEAVPGMRLCEACRQMIARLASLVGTPAPEPQAERAQMVAATQERARRLYERSLDLDIFTVAP